MSVEQSALQQSHKNSWYSVEMESGLENETFAICMSFSYLFNDVLIYWKILS